MFRTELTIAPVAGQLPRTARVLTMGSCFAESIGSRLAAHKVETRVNPFGNVFQPLALARLLRAACGEEVDWQQHLVQARGRWQSYDLHGSIGADSPAELLRYIQEVVRQTGEFLRNADLVLLTLGTAWAYRLRETGELVSNCHKQPADLFVRELLTPDEIINALAETHAYLRRLNPELRFVLTVSPVRHLKDTLPLNSVSKSMLRVATHIVSDLLPGMAYFPAFELLTDDLRDYRFYAADMLHPSEVAEDYIWDKFAHTYFDADFGRFRKEWTAVRQSLGHRPLHEGAPEHRQFLESTREKLEQLSLAQVNVADELGTVRARLAALPISARPAPVVEAEDDEERIDIGEAVRGETTSQMTAASLLEAARAEQPARGEGRPPRLSPEEFRAQRAVRPERGRRDGRGKGQAVQPNETEQFQAASFAEADEFAQQPFLPGLAPVDLTPVAAAAAAKVAIIEAAADADGLEAGRKKKRRSRGGAKRTARKHALRLATEMDMDGGQLTVSEAALEDDAEELIIPSNAAVALARAENPAAAPEIQEPRRNRRGDGGRVPARGPLFAAPAASATANAAPETFENSMAISAAADLELDAPVSSSRKSRNRKKKKSGRPVATEVADAGQNTAPAQAPRGAVEAVVDQETLNAARNDNQRNNRRPQALPVATLPTGGATAATAATPVVLVPAFSAAPTAESSQFNTPTPQAAKPSKRKSRAMVGGRTEKPAVDTPIIPVVDASMLRSQVAAGVLMGTSASLVEPTAPVKEDKRAAPFKTRAATVPVVAKAPAKPGIRATVAAPAAAAAASKLPVTKSAASAKSKMPAKAGPASRVMKAPATSTSADAKMSPAPNAAVVAPAATTAKTAPKKGMPTNAPKITKASTAAVTPETPGKTTKAARSSKAAAATSAVAKPVATPAAAPATRRPAAKSTAKPEAAPTTKPLTSPAAKALPTARSAPKAAAERISTIAKPVPTKKAPPKAASPKTVAAQPTTTKAKVPKKPTS